jgi:hypothetical protein
MDSYRVNLPRQNYWNDEHDTWLETSYRSGNAFVEPMGGDIYGIINNGSTIDNIPILIAGETEGDLD